MYEAHGNSDEWLIEYMYNTIILFDRDRTGNGQSVWFTINESYYFTVFDYMLRYLRYVQGNISSEVNIDCQGIIDVLVQKYPNCEFRGISVREIINDGLYELVKPLFYRFLKDKEFVFTSMDRINVNTFGNRKKFESMVDAL